MYIFHYYITKGFRFLFSTILNTIFIDHVYLYLFFYKILIVLKNKNVFPFFLNEQIYHMIRFYLLN